MNTSVTWQNELKAAAFKYHVLIAWVAVILNPIWVIGDYYNIPDYFLIFFIVRIFFSLCTLIGILLKNKLKKRPEIIAFIPFVGLAIQNAYMGSVMNVAELHTHVYATIALFIGAGMFVLWSLPYSFLVSAIWFIANVILFEINSPLSFVEVLINGGLLTTTVVLFTILLISTRTNLTKKEIISRLALAESNKQLAEKNEIIEEKNKDIRDSINYAQRIQHAILPPFEKIDRALTDYFIFFKPKDIVSGDFYWHASTNTTPADGSQPESVILMAAVDCTGHGVPGALMSIIGSTILNQSLTARDVNTPAEALVFLNKELAKNLNSIKDGMDMALCAINLQKMELQFAGANNPVYIVRNKKVIELKPDKMAIGADHENHESKSFTDQFIKLEKNDSVYLFTDGYADQFGGPNGKKFKYKKFQELLVTIQDSIMEEQKHILHYHHEQWKGNLEQVDDILVIGIRI